MDRLYQMLVIPLFRIQLYKRNHSLQQCLFILRRHDIVVLAEAFQHFKDGFLRHGRFFNHSDFLIYFIKSCLCILDLFIQVIQNTIQTAYFILIVPIRNVKLRQSLFGLEQIAVIFGDLISDCCLLLPQRIYICLDINLLRNKLYKLRDCHHGGYNLFHLGFQFGAAIILVGKRTADPVSVSSGYAPIGNISRIITFFSVFLFPWRRSITKDVFSAVWTSNQAGQWMQVKLTIGERLKDLRTAQKLTLEQLAAEVGISKSALGKYESDNSKDISPYSILLLADYYGVSCDYLMGRKQKITQTQLCMSCI